MTCEQLTRVFIKRLCMILQITSAVDLTGQEQIVEAEKLLYF